MRITSGVLLVLISALAPNCGGGGSGGAGRTAWPSAIPNPPPPAGATGLPTMFRFGLGNGPGGTGWMNGTGASWGYRYQYLSGDVGGGNWSEWNSPPGEFAKLYMTESRNNGYLPVLTYYCMAPSAGEANLGALRKPGLMWNYFNNFKLLLLKAGEFGDTVIIHHEPDFWAYLQAQKGDDPANVPVAVSDSGYPDVQGQPDNAAGFARALVAMRDALAPEALLAFHASNFATGFDITFGGDPDVLGQRVADFFNGLGASYDLLFNDFTDRDAGYYAAIGHPRPWDDATFDRSRQYLGKISSATGKKILIWQVPCGNTIYRTCNNSNGHYQSNHAEYFLKAANRPHIVDWAASGVIGMMFGSTLSQTTSYMDARGDNITNPAAINGNTTLATVSDDDGGFLRSSAAAYDATPVILP
jgi:hypothetical protein